MGWGQKMNEVLTQTNNTSCFSSVVDYAEHANACEMLLVPIRNNLLQCCSYYALEISIKTIFCYSIMLTMHSNWGCTDITVLADNCFHTMADNR